MRKAKIWLIVVVLAIAALACDCSGPGDCYVDDTGMHCPSTEQQNEW